MKGNGSMRHLLCMGQLLLFLLLPLLCESSESIEVTATVDSRTVGLDDYFTYQVEVSSGTKKLLDLTSVPDFPSFSAFDVVSGPSVSDEFRMVNFSTTHAKKYSIVLQPRDKGEFEIGETTVELRRKLYKTEPIKITVVEGTQKRRERRTRRRSPFDMWDDPFFNRRREREERKVDVEESIYVVADVSKKDVYVREPLILTYYLYTRLNVSNFSYEKAPDFPGFIVEEIPVESKGTEKIVEGLKFYEFPLKKWVLFPIREGGLTIEPQAFNLAVELTSHDPFDFMFGREKTVRRSTEAIEINVKPLPEEGKPEDFAGFVGSYALRTEI